MSSELKYGVRRNLIASWVAHGITILLGFYLVPFVNRVLGEEQYGAWLFINQFASYGSLLYFGFGDTVTRYVAKHYASRDIKALNQVVSLVSAVYLTMALVAILVSVVIAIFVAPLTEWTGTDLPKVQIAIVILGLNIAVALSGSVYGGVLLGMRRFDVEKSVTIVSDFVRLGMLFGLLTTDWGIPTIAAIYFVINVLENLAYWWLAHRVLPELKIDFSLITWAHLKEYTSFSSLAFVNALSMQLMYCADTIVIGTVLGKQAIVPYYVALRLVHFIKQPIEKIAQISMPTAGALHDEENRHKLQRFVLHALGLAILLSSGAMIGAVYFGDDVISTWMGEKYVGSHRFLLILLSAQMIALPCGILRQVMFGLGKAKVPTFVFMAEAFANLGLSILLCRQYQQLGVCLGTLIPICVFEIFIIVPYSLKALELSWWRLGREALLPQAIPLAALLIYAATISSSGWYFAAWPALLGVTAGAVAVLALSLWFVAMIQRTSLSPNAY